MGWLKEASKRRGEPPTQCSAVHEPNLILVVNYSIAWTKAFLNAMITGKQWPTWCRKAFEQLGVPRVATDIC
jgi:hypothetical protein